MASGGVALAALAWLCWAWSRHPCAALDLGDCGQPLGFESGRIDDAAISASSSYDAGNTGPQFARLRQDRNGGAWCPKQQAMRGVREWLQVDLGRLHVVTGVQTQGRFGNGQGQEYVEEYKLEYWRPGMERWAKYRRRSGTEILAGNTNTYTVMENQLDPVIIAAKIRLLPYSMHRRTVCLRLELLGCPFQDGVVSYSTRQGDVLGDVDLIDDMYDGISDNGFLKGGLGQLTDGQVGDDNIDADVSRHGKGYEWVGWSRQASSSLTAPAGLVEVIVEFDSVRRFSHLNIYASNDFNRNIQVFSELRVSFSVTGRRFDDGAGDAVSYAYVADTAMTVGRNVSVALGQRVGRFVKLHLHFADQWILISELYFQSEPVRNVSLAPDVNARAPVADVDLQRDPGVSVKRNRDQVDYEDYDTPRMGGGGGGVPAGGYTGAVIGVMTFVIVALIGAVVTMSLADWRRSHRPAADLHADVRKEANRRDGADLSDKMSTSGEPLYASVASSACGRAASPFSDHDRYEAFVPAVYIEPKPVASPSTLSAASSARQVDWTLNSPATATPSPPTSPSTLDLERGERMVPWMQLEPIRRLRYDLPIDLVRLLMTNVPGVASFSRLLLKALPQHCPTSVVAGECRLLRRLENENLLSLLGLTLEPCGRPWLVFQYGALGDLCQFLQDHVAETSPVTVTGPVLRYDCLIYMAKQTAAAMEHLEAHGIVHRDLATRNCVMGPNYSVKIGTFGWADRELYANDYCFMGHVATSEEFHDAPDDQASQEEPLPLRWMAWESVAMGEYSTQSDVWSFAVLLWEILSYAREQPLEQLNDADVHHLLLDYGRQRQTNLNDNQQVGPVPLLSKPIVCPKEIYDLMLECWQVNAMDRPTFSEIHMFLSRKNLGYDPAMG